MSKRLRKTLVGILFLSFTVQHAFAGEIDLLLNKLVEKGILSAGEAQQIATETKEQIKTEIAQAKLETLPTWVQTFKLKGDFRARYQYEERKGANLNLGTTTARDRGRIRLRVGAEAKVFDKAKVHFGLATGNDSDPRSTNQTFGESFAKRAVWIDYAYGEYTPWSWASFKIGRMKNPMWEPTDMLWDTDINPEGLAINLAKKLNSYVDIYMNSGVFVLDENANASDPWMYVFQPGIKVALTPDISLNLANSIYTFVQTEGWISPATARSAGSNTRNPRNGLRYNYNSFTPALELAIKDPLKQVGLRAPAFLDIPYLAIFGEYVDNFSTANSNTGYAGGLKLGHEKVAEKGQWQAKYQYVMLGTDAWPDVFPDSDRYGGRTGVRSHEVTFSYGLGKNWTVDLDYYLTTLTSATDDTTGQLKTENLIQLDLNWKF